MLVGVFRIGTPMIRIPTIWNIPNRDIPVVIVLIFQLSTGKNRLDSLVVETWKAEALFSASHRTARTFAKMLQLRDVWGLSGLSTSRRGGVSDVKYTAPPGMIQVRGN